MPDPTMHELYLAAGGDPDITDPTITDLYEAIVVLGNGAPGGSSFPLTAAVDAAGFPIQNLPDPVDDGDAASKGYVDGVAGGTALRVLDLGVVNAVDLLDGWQTVYEPAAGEFVALTVGLSDFVELTGGTQRVDVGDSAVFLGAPIVDWAPDISQDPGGSNPFGSQGIWDQFGLALSEKNIHAIRSGAPMVAAIHLFWSDVALQDAVLGWAATTAFAAGRAIQVGGQLFTSGGGTSAGSEPSWDTASLGNETVDDSITWTYEGLAPTAGSFHLYALVATPIAP